MVTTPSGFVSADVKKVWAAASVAVKYTVCVSPGRPLEIVRVAMFDQRPPATTFSVPSVRADGACRIAMSFVSADARCVSVSSNAARSRYRPGPWSSLNATVASPLAFVTAERCWLPMVNVTVLPASGRVVPSACSWRCARKVCVERYVPQIVDNVAVGGVHGVSVVDVIARSVSSFGVSFATI